MEKDVFDSIQMNCHCFDYIYNSVTVSAFTERSIEGNKFVACISFFGQLLKERCRQILIVLYIAEKYKAVEIRCIL